MKKIAVVFGALLIAGSVVALAQGRGPHGRMHDAEGAGPEMHVEFMAQRLDLTDGQRAQVEQLMTAHHDAMAAHRDEARAAHEALAEQMHAETFDEAAVRSAAEAVAELQVEGIVERARLMQQIRQLLTPEQQQKMEQLRERRRGMGWDAMPPGGAGPHGMHHAPGRP